MTVGIFDDVKDIDLKLVKIKGCKYKIPENETLALLGLYGEVTSSLEEDCFRDASATTGKTGLAATCFDEA